MTLAPLQSPWNQATDTTYTRLYHGLSVWWKILSNGYTIITLCSVSMATTQPSIGTNVIVVTCYGNNNAWNPIDQPSYLVLYTLACAPNSIPEKSVTVCMHNFHYSVYYNSLTSIGAIALARALQQNKSLEELKWVQTDWCSKGGFIGYGIGGKSCNDDRLFPIRRLRSIRCRLLNLC